MSGGCALIPVIVVLALCAWFYDHALAAAAFGGDVKQAPGEAPQSGPKGNAQTPSQEP